MTLALIKTLGIRTELKGLCFSFFGKTPFDPSTGKLRLAVIRPEFLLGPKNPVFCDFPPLVRSAKTLKVNRLRTGGEKLLGRPDFFPRSTPSTGKLCFSVFGPGPGFLEVPRAVLGQNGLKPPFFVFSCPWGSGRPKRKNVKKIAENHHG